MLLASPWLAGLQRSLPHQHHSPRHPSSPLTHHMPTPPTHASHANPPVRHCNGCFFKGVNWDASKTYDVFGPPTGHPVLMLHGALIGRMSMIHEARAMGEKVGAVMTAPFAWGLFAWGLHACIWCVQRCVGWRRLHEARFV